MPNPEIKTGIFKEEIKNRFLCTVNIDGIDTVCYIPSSCRLSNFINLKGRQVMLQPVKKKNGRTKYAVHALKFRRSYILLNLSSANRIIENQLYRKIFCALGSRKHVSHEKLIDGYKSDLYIEDTDTIVEIKSILSFDKEVLFPSIFSERAIRQLDDIRQLLDNGHKVCYMFASMYPGVKSVWLDRKQVEYYKRFCECINKGMTVCAFSIGMKEGVPFIKTRVDVKI